MFAPNFFRYFLFSFHLFNTPPTYCVIPPSLSSISVSLSLLSLYLSLSLSLSHTHTHSYTHRVSFRLFLSLLYLSVSFSFSLSLSLCLSVTHTHTTSAKRSKFNFFKGNIHGFYHWLKKKDYFLFLFLLIKNIQNFSWIFLEYVYYIFFKESAL